MPETINLEALYAEAKAKIIPKKKRTATTIEPKIIFKFIDTSDSY